MIPVTLITQENDVDNEYDTDNVNNVENDVDNDYDIDDVNNIEKRC